LEKSPAARIADFFKKNLPGCHVSAVIFVINGFGDDFLSDKFRLKPSFKFPAKTGIVTPYNSGMEKAFLSF